jgi:hypothetical protein
LGVILFIDLEKPIHNLQDNLGGKAWARVDRELNALAQQLKLTPLDDLTSCGAEQLAEYGAPDEVVNDFQEQWFEPEEGIRTVQGLLDHLRQHAEITRSFKHPQYVLDDLTEALKILRAAAQERVRFHFSWAV